jgi:hypothetical protein
MFIDSEQYISFSSLMEWTVGLYVFSMFWEKIGNYGIEYIIVLIN